MTPIQQTETILRELRGRTDEILLFYSCGKDSIVLLDLCRKYFKKITCVYMAFLPGLEHNRRLLDHVKPNELIEVTHWMTSKYLTENYMRMYKALNVKKLKQKDIEDSVKAKTGIEWIVTGMKQNDSLNRRLMLRRFHMEAIDEKMKRCHPLSHWKNKEVHSYITFNKLPRPIEYEPGRPSQGIGLDPVCLLYLRTHYPRDYKKIIDVFPLAETNLLHP